MGVSVRSVCQGSGTAGAVLSRSLRCLPCPHSRFKSQAVKKVMAMRPTEHPDQPRDPSSSVRLRGIARPAIQPQQSQRADIRHGGWEEAYWGEIHSRDSGGRGWKKIVWLETIPEFLAGWNGNGRILRKPFLDFRIEGMET